MSEIRDTHFQGFAKLLWDELVELNKGGYIDVSSYFDDGIDPTNYRLLIAQRAYDLVAHALEDILPYYTYDEFKEWQEYANDVPDLTAWPPTPPEP